MLMQHKQHMCMCPPHPILNCGCAQIGNLSARTRVVRIKNVLTGQEDNLEVGQWGRIMQVWDRVHAGAARQGAWVKTDDRPNSMGIEDMHSAVWVTALPCIRFYRQITLPACMLAVLVQGHS
jgi:hypothetical protein